VTWLVDLVDTRGRRPPTRVIVAAVAPWCHFRCFASPSCSSSLPQSSSRSSSATDKHRPAQIAVPRKDRHATTIGGLSTVGWRRGRWHDVASESTTWLVSCAARLFRVQKSTTGVVACSRLSCSSAISCWHDIKRMVVVAATIIHRPLAHHHLAR